MVETADKDDLVVRLRKDGVSWAQNLFNEAADEIERLRRPPDPAVAEPVYKAVERILDEQSAWIARPSPDVTKAVALAATVAAHRIIEEQRSIPDDPADPAAVEVGEMWRMFGWDKKPDQAVAELVEALHGTVGALMTGRHVELAIKCGLAALAKHASPKDAT